MQMQRTIQIKEKRPIEPSLSVGCYAVAYLLFFIVLVLGTLMVSQLFFISTDGLLLKFVLFLLFVSPYFAFPWWLARQRGQIGEMDLRIVEQNAQEITFALLFYPRRALELTHIHAQLTIYEYQTRPPKASKMRQSAYSIPKITYLAQEQCTIALSLSLLPEEAPLTQQITLPIPPNMPATYEQEERESGIKSGISWDVTVKMGLKSWISWEKSVLFLLRANLGISTCHEHGKAAWRAAFLPCLRRRQIRMKPKIVWQIRGKRSHLPLSIHMPLSI